MYPVIYSMNINIIKYSPILVSESARRTFYGWVMRKERNTFNVGKALVQRHTGINAVQKTYPWTHYGAKDDVEIMIPLPLPPHCWVCNASSLCAIWPPTIAFGQSLAISILAEIQYQSYINFSTF